MTNKKTIDMVSLEILHKKQKGDFGKYMKNPKIAEILKSSRKKKGYSVDEVALFLTKTKEPISPKTIYGWENGVSQPNADILMALCQYYENDDILGTFGYQTTADDKLMPLTIHEENLLKAYRSQTQMQPAVDKLLGIEK